MPVTPSPAARTDSESACRGPAGTTWLDAATSSVSPRRLFNGRNYGHGRNYAAVTLRITLVSMPRVNSSQLDSEAWTDSDTSHGHGTRTLLLVGFDHQPDGPGHVPSHGCRVPLRNFLPGESRFHGGPGKVIIMPVITSRLPPDSEPVPQSGSLAVTGIMMTIMMILSNLT